MKRHILFCAFAFGENDLSLQCSRDKKTEIGADSGNALVGVLVAMVLGGGLIAGLSRNMGDLAKTQQSLNAQGDLNVMKQVILSRTSCDETFKPGNGFDSDGSCIPGRFLRLEDSKGNTVVSENPTAPTTIGKWVLRATCLPDKSIELRAAQPIVARGSLGLNGVNGFRKDPATKRVLNWVEGPVLYGQGEVCGGYRPGNGQNDNRPSSPGITEVKSPMGKCVLRTKQITSASPLGSNGVHRSESISCSAPYGALLSVNTLTACNGDSWISSMQRSSPSSFPVRGVCGVVLLNDRKDVDEAQRQAMRDICSSMGQQWTAAECQVICCQL